MRKKQDSLVDIFGKLPPQAIELEEAILGALLTMPCYLKVSEKIGAEDFYKESNKVIFQAATTLFNNGSPIDMLTVIQQLKKDGALEMAGGAYNISGLTSKVTSYEMHNIEFHAEIIRQKSTQRKLIVYASELLQKAFDDTTDVNEMLREAEKNVSKIGQSLETTNVIGYKSIAEKAILDIINNNNKPLVDVIELGYNSMKGKIVIEKGDLVFIGGRSGMGKTSFGLNIVVNNFRHQIKSGFLSLEMTAEKLTQKIISLETFVPTEEIKNRNVSEENLNKIANYKQRLLDLLYIDDSTTLSLSNLKTRCLNMVKKHGVKFILVDYLALIKSEGNKNSTEESRISDITRELKLTAKECEVPILCLAQLSRPQKGVAVKRPSLDDLKGSGSIEANADMVLFIHRPEYYGVMVDEENNSTQGIAEILVAKYRNGALGMYQLSWNNEVQGFYDKSDSIFNSFASIKPNTSFDLDYKPLDEEPF